MANLNLMKRTGLRSKMRVGRGGKRGKTAGRGTKGQNARAGHKKRPEMRDIIKKLPKRRGYGKNRSRTVNDARRRFVALSLTKIDARFNAGETITVKALVEKGMVHDKGGKLPLVKIVGGETSKALVFSGIPVTAAAKTSLEKAGGSTN